MPKEQEGSTPDISFTREIRGQIFVWFGIAGGALTIVNHSGREVTAEMKLRCVNILK
jgi:hypothetical protein